MSAWRYFLIAFACLGLFAGTAQAATQIRNPGACANTAGIGSVAWTAAGNALTSDDAHASATVNGVTTNYLSCTNYGFAIPPGSRVDGITVNVERKSDRVSNNGSNDAAVRLIKGGAIGTADRSSTTVYAVLDVTEAHGGATDLWGETWTAADINAAQFGAAIAAVKPSPNGPAHVITVDAISITIDYTPPPTVSSITRLDPNPTSAPSVSWSVVFSEAVSGVDTGDFALAAVGLSGMSITSVSGGPIIFIVSANTGFGVGTLGLNVADNDTVISVLTAVPLGGTGFGNGDFTGPVYNVDRPPPVASFNVVEPNADALTGRIFTKIAGQDIAVDIVALDSSNAVSTGFIGTVAVELVDNSSGAACASLPLIRALALEAFAPGDSGRHRLSAGQFELEAYRNVKFRIKHPIAAPTVISCSSDAFANRPSAFVFVQVRDQDRTTAGIARTLDNVADPGTGTVHNAGRPFRIDATAHNAAVVPAPTLLYTPDAGQPVANLSQCASGTAACVATPASLALGAWSAAAGILTTTTAAYPDVGSFALVLEDRTFSSVDDADGTLPDVRYIKSAAALTVGRFVPDHFAIDAGAAITPRSDIAACSGSSFTYMSERMDLVFTLRARAFGGSDTASYAGTLGALPLNAAASYDLGAIDSAVPTLLSTRVDVSLVPGVVASWSAGAATVAVPVAITRDSAPDGPYGAVRIGIAPSDADGVTLATLDLDADNSGSNERGQVGGTTALRFGRLRMENAVGSEKLDLPIPIQVQHWAGAAFQTNTADSCTSIAAANIQFSDYFGGIDAANMNAANISGAGAPFASGLGNLTLTKPLPAPSSPGAVTLTVDLTAEAKSYLKGNWGVGTYTADPKSRAAFGLYGGQPKNFIYFRENY